jgi:Tripartite tricarboxylate transporter TctB family
MGPGLFPMCISAVLTVLGAAALLQGTRRRASAGIVMFRPISPALVVSAAVFSFAYLLDRAGLGPATLALTLIAQQPRWRSRPIEVVIVAVILAIIVPAVFIYGLGLPFRLFRFH